MSDSPSPEQQEQEILKTDTRSVDEISIELYRVWFENNPGARNPSDLNTLRKFNYAVEIGFQDHHLMACDRKAGKAWVQPQYFSPTK